MIRPAMAAKGLNPPNVIVEKGIAEKIIKRRNCS